MKQEYLNSISFLDSIVTKLIRDIRESERKHHRTIFIVTADHGEMFNETGEIWNIGHTGHVLEYTVHVPFFIWGDQIEPRVYTGLAEGIDLAPTILKLAGMPATNEMTGNDLFANQPKRQITAYSPFETYTVMHEGDRFLTEVRLLQPENDPID